MTGPPAAAPGLDPLPDQVTGESADERSRRLRKRPRRRSAGASPMPVGQTPDAATTPPPAAVSSNPPPHHGSRDRRVDHTERALRGLVTTRGTQVSWSAATRARDVAMPTAVDLAQAADEVVIVQRNYTPPEPLASGRSGDAPRPRRRPN